MSKQEEHVIQVETVVEKIDQEEKVLKSDVERCAIANEELPMFYSKRRMMVAIIILALVAVVGVLLSQLNVIPMEYVIVIFALDVIGLCLAVYFMKRCSGDS